VLSPPFPLPLALSNLTGRDESLMNFWGQDFQTSENAVYPKSGATIYAHSPTYSRGLPPLGASMETNTSFQPDPPRYRRLILSEIRATRAVVEEYVPGLTFLEEEGGEAHCPLSPAGAYVREGSHRSRRLPEEPREQHHAGDAEH
jgi:hypothetical protein